MQDCTAFRLAMLRNGFVPTLNDCKKAIETGWPRRVVDEAEVLSWDRSACRSTGMKVDGDLAVIDVDVDDAALVETLAQTLDRDYPELFQHGFVRHAGGAKEAWFARVDKPFRRLASRRWYRDGSDPDDPAVAKQQVECFGSCGTRQFAVDGPHTRHKATVVSSYRFAGKASPATMPRSSLPVLPRAAYEAACDRFDAIAAAAGLKAIKACSDHGGTTRVFKLDPDTVVETQDYGAITVAALERLMKARRAGANAASALRCSGSFHDPTRVRTDSHLIGWGRYGLSIWDSMTELTWHRRDKATTAETFAFLAQLQQRSIFHDR